MAVLNIVVPLYSINFIANQQGEAMRTVYIRLKQVFTLSALLISCTALFAQHITLKGLVLNENLKTPIPFATVTVLNQDSTVIATTISDTTGKFILSNLTI